MESSPRLIVATRRRPAQYTQAARATRPIDPEATGSRTGTTNARSSCYKVEKAGRAWLQGFHGLLGCPCNDLAPRGYKQMFAKIGEANIDT
jgi:hypothetical protein